MGHLSPDRAGRASDPIGVSSRVGASAQSAASAAQAAAAAATRQTSWQLAARGEVRAGGAAPLMRTLELLERIESGGVVHKDEARAVRLALMQKVRAETDSIAPILLDSFAASLPRHEAFPASPRMQPLPTNSRHPIIARARARCARGSGSSQVSSRPCVPKTNTYLSSARRRSSS